MPREKNPALRAAVTFIVVLAALGVAVAMWINTTKGPAGPAAPGSGGQTDQAETEPGPDADQPPQEQPAPTSDEPAEEADPDRDEPTVPPPGVETTEAEPTSPEATGGAEDAAALGPLHARPWGQEDPQFSPLGSSDPESGYRVRLEFTPRGAGVEAITLADYFQTIAGRTHYAIQRRAVAPVGGGQAYTIASLAARAVILQGQEIDLFSRQVGPIWRETAPGAFEAEIVTDEGETVARIEKAYRLRPGSYDITIEQRLVNLTERPLETRWVQYGPVDLPFESTGYGGDRRRVRFGELYGPQRDPSRQIVVGGDLTSRSSAMPDGGVGAKRVWPSDAAADEGRELVWAAMTNRYFAFAVHPTVPESVASSAAPFDKSLDMAGHVDFVAIGGAGDVTGVLQLTSPARRVDPGGAVGLGFSAYAGPKWLKILREEPQYNALGLDDLVVFNFGGPCAFCTFQWLAHFLHTFLSFVHDHIVFDWAMAILILVVCVRGVLHPVTKRSQISIQRFSKKMQALAPKQQQLREKYKDDPKRMQQEMAKLMREEGVNPAQALGCLPMFLQTPVWIALFAMLFYAFDLRHEPAFYGVVQAATGGAWSFLGDLAAPDGFIDFGRTLVTLPLLGEIRSINVMPLLMGVVFFIQQKYLTPPPSAAMSPEQQTQQKVMRVMMVVMFPVIIYNAPSGLAVYFVTNSTLGILEGRYIRSHITKEDLEGDEEKRPPTRKKVASQSRPSPVQQRYKQRRKKK